MKKVLYLDCFAGISGDMTLGALIDLGVDINVLKKELSKLKLDDQFEISVQQELKNGIAGKNIQIKVKKEQHHHRHYQSIVKILTESDLEQEIQEKSLEMFRFIGEAEAKIHDKTLEEIHFHEVGAIDSIVDVVGVAICMNILKPDLIISSAVQVGGGMVKCAHGLFPVPAPATSEILKNIPIKMDLVDQELTTPTGAAIIATYVSSFDTKSIKSQKIGYGLGDKTFDQVPNVLRAIIGEVNQTSELPTTKCFTIECNIDDESQEILAALQKQLLSNGADDVFFTPIFMKKSRPAYKLTVLCNQDHLDMLIKTVLNDSSTFGLRYFEGKKIELEREFVPIRVNNIEVRIKCAFMDGELVKFKPEFEDVSYLAENLNISVKAAFDKVTYMFQKQLTQDD